MEGMEKLKGRNVDIRIPLSVETLGLTNNAVKTLLLQSFALHRFTFSIITITKLNLNKKTWIKNLWHLFTRNLHYTR